MNDLFLTVEQTCSAHDYMSGNTTALDALLQNSEPGQIVKLPATPETIYHLESIWRLLAQKGLKPILLPSKGLDARGQEFFDDFRHAFLKSERPNREIRTSVFQDRLSLLRHATLAFFGFGPGPVIEARHMPSVVLLGACSIRHAGDAARLAGVLLALKRDFGTSHATILSKRPEHTKRLIASIDTPVELSVIPCSHKEVRWQIPHNDGVALIGGPLTGTPRKMAIHLKAMRLAAIWGKPFVMRDVEIGPFDHGMSGWIVRQLALHSADLSVRTHRSEQAPELHGISTQVGHDPAIDYLQSRPEKLGKIRAPEKSSIDRLLENTNGRHLIGLNIHSIEQDRSNSGLAYANGPDSRFLEKIADVMNRLTRSRSKPITFVLFPMNSLPSDSSDLEAAYQLHRHVGARADLRVFEAAPAVDDLLYLLRQMDAVVSTRYFGCIFGLSQNVPTFGIDNSLVPGGPIEKLFDGFGQKSRFRHLDDFHTDWLDRSIGEILQPKQQQLHVDFNQSA